MGRSDSNEYKYITDIDLIRKHSFLIEYLNMLTRDFTAYTHKAWVLVMVQTKNLRHLAPLEGVDRGGGGTGVEGAESGVECAESGVEGAGSGGRGGGKRG